MLSSSLQRLVSLYAAIFITSNQKPLVEPVNKGIVAFGSIPAAARDSTGTTIGGIGSAIAIKRGSFSKLANGSYTGSLIVQPDRGYNVEETVDFQGRQHELQFTLTPYSGSANLPFPTAQETLSLLYKNTLLYTERAGKATTGFDAISARPATEIDPTLPVPSATTIGLDRLSLDLEGLVLNQDGSFWVSDEYGPYIYRFFGNGTLDFVIQPPRAVLPFISGQLNYTSAVNPDSGRAANQGFEAMTASPDGQTLYAMLQTATIQDGGDDDKRSRYARLFQYDVSSSPTLTGEWVVPLPQTSKGKTIAQNEIHYLDGLQFLILARDGKGHGDDTTLSAHKSVDIFDITEATNIAGTSYDLQTAVSPKGKLAKKIIPATYTEFVSLIDPTQLARFGLHNGGRSDQSLIAAKWEGLALAPCYDPAYPNDYFLFVAADNDFMTQNGMMVGQPYSHASGEDVDNQFLVFQVTLPMVPADSVGQSIAL